MAKTREQKQQIVENLKNQLSQVKGAVFADFTGLKVNELEDLRAKLKENDSRFTVTKRSLLKLAFMKAGLDFDIDSLNGSLSLATSSRDEVAPAKILVDFAKRHEALKINGGILEQKFIDIAKVQELAKLPNKNELLAKIVGSIQAPISGLVTVLQGNLRGLVRVLDAVRASKS